MSWQAERKDPPGWKAQRKRVLARDEYLCQLRLSGCTGDATDVDHIVENWKRQRPATDDELQAACSHCNQLKNYRDMSNKKLRVNHPSRLETKRIKRKKNPQTK